MRKTNSEKGNKLYINIHNTKGEKKSLYVQEFINSKNLAKTFKEDAQLLGSMLNKFHMASNVFLNSNQEKPPDCVKKNSEDILKVLYSWGKDDYFRTHKDESLRKSYKDLIEFSKSEIDKYHLDEEKYNIPRTVVHGDYNPGNIIISSQSKEVKIIDFDDLRIDHPACDLSHALCQTMVFMYFDKSMPDRVIPSKLSDESKNIGKRFIKAYFEDCKDKDFVDEMFVRLEKEMPLAIHRGVLLGFLDFKISSPHLENAASNISSLNSDITNWLKDIKKDVLK